MTAFSLRYLREFRVRAGDGMSMAYRIRLMVRKSIAGRRWGLPVGLVQHGEASVTRNEEQKLTIYKLALPWSELTPIAPQHGDVMSFSLLVNENDGQGRGWIEWARGIGSEKRPSLFRSMQWMMPTQ